MNRRATITAVTRWGKRGIASTPLKLCGLYYTLQIGGRHLPRFFRWRNFAWRAVVAARRPSSRSRLVGIAIALEELSAFPFRKQTCGCKFDATGLFTYCDAGVHCGRHQFFR